MTVIKFPGKRRLVVDTTSGVITADGPTDPSHADRIERIRERLDNINRLMAQLREMSDDNSNCPRGY